MHKAKLDLTDLPEWGARIFMRKTITGKLDQKSTEGHWMGYSGTSKGHHIYRENKVVSVEWNVTFKNAVLTVPDAISITGEYKHESIQKTSNQNATVQGPSKDPSHSNPWLT